MKKLALVAALAAFPQYVLADPALTMRANCRLVMTQSVCRAFNQANKTAATDPSRPHVLGFGLGMVTRGQWYEFNSDPAMCERIPVECKRDWSSPICRLSRAQFKQ